MNIIINYPNKSVERWLSSPCEEHKVQELVIQRLFKADLWKPAPWDTDALRRYHQNIQNIKRGHGEVLTSMYYVNEWFDKITWDMHINEAHDTLTVDVFVEYYADKD